MNLKGRKAVVTGAASGIGRACAEALMLVGADVVGLDAANPSDNSVDIIKVDLLYEADIVAGIAAAVSKLGQIDILVNAAGVLKEAALSEETAENVDFHLSVNVRGTILTTREALASLSDGARIINVSSELATLGRQNLSTYVASKAAIVGLTRSWARELAPRVLVNAVAPGPTDTPLLGFAYMTPEQQALETAHPLARLGRPSEVADAVVFLAGEGATFITGHCLAVNGGAAMT